jgi:hypothetical protein
MSAPKAMSLLAMISLVVLTAQAGDHGWKCEWFGIGCPDGEQNQVLMDLGRESTNTGFLFFDADTAVVERTLELTFSKRAIAKQDKLYIQVAADGLPEGATVTLDGTSCLEPDEVAFMARKSKEQVVLRWIIPPSGEDVDLEGAVRIRPYGFDRAGSMPLSGREGRSMDMLRIQGEVDHDWHWSKRLTFWFWAIVLTFLGLVKFFFAPVFFHPRLKVNRARVQCFPESGPFAQGMGSMIQSKNWKGARQVWLVGSPRKNREKRSVWKDFLFGRTVVEVRDYLGEAEFRVRKGARSRRGGMRVEVMKWETGKKSPHSVYSSYDPEQNRIPFVGESQSRIVQFEIE